MCILGLWGLVLWGPKKGQWKYAFKEPSIGFGPALSSRASWRHRQLDFPRLPGGELLPCGDRLAADLRHAERRGAMPSVEPAQGRRLGATEAVIAAQRAVPGLEARSVTIPGAPDQPISVGYLSHDAIAATAYIDPWRGTVLSGATLGQLHGLDAAGASGLAGPGVEIPGVPVGPGADPVRGHRRGDVGQEAPAPCAMSDRCLKTLAEGEPA